MIWSEWRERRPAKEPVDLESSELVVCSSDPRGSGPPRQPPLAPRSAEQPSC
jgi:hypothetical protein